MNNSTEININAIRAIIRNRWLVIAMILGIGLCGCLVMLAATRWGPWAFSDGVGYVLNARNLIIGDGIGLWRASGQFVTTTFHPPLYILLLASFNIFNIDPLIGARYLSVSLFSLMVLMMGFSTLKITKDSLQAMLVAGLTVSQPVFIIFFSGIMAEGLFLLTGFSALMAAVYAVVADKAHISIYSAVLAGLAFLTRNAGISYIITVSIFFFLFSSRSWTFRIKLSTLILIIGILPYSSWLLWLRFQPTADRIGLSIGGIRNLWVTLEPVRVALVDSYWKLLPLVRLAPISSYRFHLLLLLATFSLLFIFVLSFWFRTLRTPPPHDRGHLLTSVFILFTFIYLLVVILSFLFRQPTPDVDRRILSPAFFSLVLSLVLLLLRFGSLMRFRFRWLYVISIFIPALVITWNVAESKGEVQFLFERGNGYTQRSWQSSPTIKALDDVPTDIPIITNETAAVLLYTNRAAYEFNEFFSVNETRRVDAFGDHPTSVIDKIFREEHAFLVIFDTVNEQFEALDTISANGPLSSLIAPLDVYSRQADGTIYRYPD